MRCRTVGSYTVAHVNSARAAFHIYLRNQPSGASRRGVARALARVSTSKRKRPDLATTGVVEGRAPRRLHR